VFIVAMMRARRGWLWEPAARGKQFLTHQVSGMPREARELRSFEGCCTVLSHAGVRRVGFVLMSPLGCFSGVMPSEWVRRAQAVARAGARVPGFEEGAVLGIARGCVEGRVVYLALTTVTRSRYDDQTYSTSIA
jgi:hypothetical protein